MKTKVPFAWQAEQEAAKRDIESRLRERIGHRHPNWDQEFHVLATGGQKGLAGTIFQYDDEGNPTPIVFISRSLRNAECRYFEGELDLLTVIHMLKRCSYLLALRKVKIHSRPIPRDLIKATPYRTSRLTQCAIILSQYQVEFVPIRTPVTHLAKYHHGILFNKPDKGLPLPTDCPSVNGHSDHSTNYLTAFSSSANKSRSQSPPRRKRRRRTRRTRRTSPLTILASNRL